jgi:hypothetical protein
MAGLALLVALIAYPRTAAVTPPSLLAGAQFTTITNWEGAEEGAEISKDGKFIAFLSDQDGEFDIWLTQIGSGIISNLTRDVPALAAAGTIVRKLGFTGDGSELWFNPGDRKPLLLMPFTGGTSRVFLPEQSNTPAWSNDGTQLVFFGKPPNGDDRHDPGAPPRRAARDRRVRGDQPPRRRARREDLVEDDARVADVAQPFLCVLRKSAPQQQAQRFRCL